MRCDEVAPLLPAMSDGTVVLPSDMAAHVEHCLRCQAELVQHREQQLAPGFGQGNGPLGHTEARG